MKCATCTAASASGLNSGGQYDQPSQGQQGDPSSPQPTLQCNTTTSLVDAALPDTSASLTNYTQGLKGVAEYQALVVARTAPVGPLSTGQPRLSSLFTVAVPSLHAQSLHVDWSEPMHCGCGVQAAFPDT